MGLSNALERVTYITNGSNSNMLVKVKGSFKPGSFDVDLVTLLTCTSVQSVVNSISVIGFIQYNMKSLIWLFKYAKGESIKSIKEIDNNNVELSFVNCNNVTVNNHIANAYQDKILRKEMENFIYPLEDVGMDDITLLHEDIEQVKITRDERKYFYSLDDEVLVTTGTDYFLVTQSNFEGKRTGWKMVLVDSINLRHGKKDFSVKIQDKKFLKSVRNQKSIITNEGTIIKAKYQKTIHNLNESTWEIMEVLDNNIMENIKTKSTKLNDF